MKRNSLLSAVIAGLMLCSGAIASPTTTQAACPEYVEFIFSQNVSVQTITCGKFTIANDVNGVGYLTASVCSGTGPLLNQSGTSGNVTVDVTMIDGTHYQFGGCRVATHGSPNFWQIGMFCT